MIEKLSIFRIRIVPFKRVNGMVCLFLTYTRNQERFSLDDQTTLRPFGRILAFHNSTSLSTGKHSLNSKKKSIIKCKQAEQPKYLLPRHGRSAVECVLLISQSIRELVIRVTHGGTGAERNIHR